MNYYTIYPARQFPFEPINEIQPKLSWWVKITTAIPCCIYYFGPFDSQGEASEAHYGYIEDLMAENASEIKFEILQDRPKLLTICE